MKAIHNEYKRYKSTLSVGNYKLKYNFESNSQPCSLGSNFSYVGNYKLKYNFESNSQHVDHFYWSCYVGNYKLKYNFESNSQPKPSYSLAKACWEL